MKLSKVQNKPLCPHNINKPSGHRKCFLCYWELYQGYQKQRFVWKEDGGKSLELSIHNIWEASKKYQVQQLNDYMKLPYAFL